MATTTPHYPAPDLSALPTYSGALSQDFTLWVGHLLAYFRACSIPEDDESQPNGRRHDLLLLALERDSIAQRYLLSRPLQDRITWKHSLAVLQEYFASPARLRMREQAALNALYARAFRDEAHRGESVQDLITDFEKMALQAKLSNEACMQMFAWTFRKYAAASRMLRRALTLEVAFIEALRWEKMLISRTLDATGNGSSNNDRNQHQHAHHQIQDHNNDKYDKPMPDTPTVASTSAGFQ